MKKNNSKIQFLWEGKEEALLQHLTPPSCTYEQPNDIQGNEIHCVDNLDFLKLNQERLRGKVKCIYIDPPYNTGRDFIYKDKRHGRGECKHSKWLSFMYPRLMVAREMLREDGVIFISIDDNEVHHLRLLMNEIFGEEEFVGQIQRKTRGSATTKSDAELQTLNDYILVYWKNKEISKFNLKNTGQKTYPFEDERGQFYIVQLQDNGPHGTRTARPNLYYPIYQDENGILSMERKNEDDKEFLPKRHKNDDGRWMWSPKKFLTDCHDLFIKDDKVYIKHYYNEEEDQNRYQREKTWLDEFQNAKGTIELNSLFTEKGLFDNPKPVSLIKHLLQISTSPSDLILDFFAGSGTTGQAVMELNQEEIDKQAKDGLLAEKGAVAGGRKFILVQLPEKIDEKKEAFKAGYKKISDITIERVKRAGEKYKSVDVNFKVFNYA